MRKSFFKRLNSMANFRTKFPLNYMVPLYHCVSDEYLPHIKNVISYKNSKDFESDLDYISKKFDFVDWDFFKDNLHKPNKKPVAILTFDDGLIEFKDVVLPILQRKGIYAINFVNPAFVDNKEMMFRFKASLVIEKILDTQKAIPNSVLTFLDLKNDSKEEAIQKIKGISYKNREKFADLSNLLEIDFDEYLKDRKVYMDLEDLHGIKNQGFGVASHSWDHPYFYELSLEEQLENVQKSLGFMKENNFSEEVFAFPFTDYGVTKSFFEEIFKKNENLKNTFGISGAKLDSFSRNLHRIPMENNFSAEEEINFESNYFNMKKILNKNIVTRI